METHQINHVPGANVVGFHSHDVFQVLNTAGDDHRDTRRLQSKSFGL